MPGEILLYSGFGAFIVSFILCFFICVRGRSDLKLFHTRALIAGFILLSLALLLMIYYFISDNFSVYYVWLYSSRDMPVFYKLAAVWAGQQGTFLLWAWISSASLFWFLARKQHFSPLPLLFAECVVLLLFLLTVLSEPFKLMSQLPHFAGAAVSDGAGLDPELLSPWMALHPPITFIAYATMTVPFAASCAYFLGDGVPLARRWAEFSWLFFSLGVGLIGGLWTYEAGWGIWTWDASEAGSLVPWLLLTAALHQHKKQELEALLFVLTFISILFAAFIIRSGIWGSVHEFAGTSTNYVLEVTLLLITLAFIYLVYRNREKFSVKADSGSLAAGIMVLLGAIVFIGLSLPLWMKISGDEASVGAEFYNLSCYPFVLLLLILLGVCMFEEHGAQIGVIAGVLSIALAFITPSGSYMLAASAFSQQPSALTRTYASLSLLSMIPPLIFALAAVLWRMRKTTGIFLIHAGVVMIFFGGVFATSFASEYTFVFAVDEVGKTMSLGGYDISLSKFHVEQNQRANWVQRATVEVRRNEKSLGSTTVSYTRDKTGNYASSGIIRKPEADIFITFPGLEPVSESAPIIPLHVKIYPLLNIFWLGDMLLSIGIILLMLRKCDGWKSSAV